MNRKPMTEYDPVDAGGKLVRKHVGYALRCDQCNEVFMLYRTRRIRQHQFRSGYNQYRFCSAECMRKFKDAHR